MGVDIRLRPSMFEEALTTIRALWRGESVTVDGRWRLHKSRIAPLPPEPIEVWIGASAKVAIERAARLGDAWLADPGMDFETARRRIDDYREACQRLGRTPIDDRDPPRYPRRRVGRRGAQNDGAISAQRLSGFFGRRAADRRRGTSRERIAELGAMGYTDVIIRNISSEQQRSAGDDRAAGDRRSTCRNRERDLMPSASLARSARRLRAIAQIGQTYTRDRYDRERFDELAAIANEMLADLTGAPLEAIVGIYLPERGYATPKVDVRAGVFTMMATYCSCRKPATDVGHCRAAGQTSRTARSSRASARYSRSPAIRVRAIKLAAIKDRSCIPNACAPRTHLQAAFRLRPDRRRRRP